jgi:hypothetical protein
MPASCLFCARNFGGPVRKSDLSVAKGSALPFIGARIVTNR